jgi:hypothetical protein
MREVGMGKMKSSPGWRMRMNWKMTTGRGRRMGKVKMKRMWKIKWI